MNIVEIVKKKIKSATTMKKSAFGFLHISGVLALIAQQAEFEVISRGRLFILTPLFYLTVRHYLVRFRLVSYRGESDVIYSLA